MIALVLRGLQLASYVFGSAAGASSLQSRPFGLPVDPLFTSHGPGLVGEFEVSMGVLLDDVSATMMLMGDLSVLIHVFSMGYIADDKSP